MSYTLCSEKIAPSHSQALSEVRLEDDHYMRCLEIKNVLFIGRPNIDFKCKKEEIEEKILLELQKYLEQSCSKSRLDRHYTETDSFILRGRQQAPGWTMKQEPYFTFLHHVKV